MKNNRCVVMKTPEEYALKLAVDVAKKGIKIALGDTKDNTDMYQIPFNAESDGRICNKVYTLLKDLGIVESFNYNQGTFYNNSHYHYSPIKERKQWYGSISPEWFIKNSSALGVAPVFLTSGLRKEKEYSFSTTETNKLVNDLDNYRSLWEYEGHISDAEYIYIYWHLNEYDIIPVTKRRATKNYEKYIVLKIYPKILLTDLSKGVFIGHVTNYLDKHIEWVIKHVLNIPNDRILNKVELSNLRDPTFKIKDMAQWNGEFVSKQLQRINSLQTMLKLGAESYTRLNEAVAKVGGWDRLKVIAWDKFMNYLEENFPMHLGEDEKDKDLKKLCEWVMQGKHKGFSELQQRVASTTTQEV